MSAIVVRIDAKTGDAARIATVVTYVFDPTTSKPGERLIFAGSGNMFATDPVGMSKEMRALADDAKALDSRVSIDPFEHFVISFESHDSLSKADCEVAVSIALRHLGLQDHPYVWGAHDDTGNRHIHLGVLRINPNNLKAVSVAYVVKQAEQVGALINHDLDMPAMQHNRYTVDDHGILAKAVSSRVREPNKLVEIIKTSKSWEDFHARTRAIGINYERKGSGALINGEKASDVHYSASFAKLSKKWGQYVQAVGALDLPSKPPQDVERARLRAQIRKTLSDTQRQERSDAYQAYKMKKADIWQTPGNSIARVALSSFIAKDYASVMADLRDKQRQQRNILSKQLDMQMPLLARLQVENSFSANVSKDIVVSDIRAYIAFADPSDRRRIIYSTSQHGRADFVDSGNKVAVYNQSDDAILAALQLSQAKFGSKLTVNGSDAFKLKAMRIAAANNIVIANPELQDQLKAEILRLQKERLSQASAKYPAREDFIKLAAAVPAQRWRVAMGPYLKSQELSASAATYKPVLILRDDASPAPAHSSKGNGHDELSVDRVCDKWGYLELAQDDPNRSKVMLTAVSDSHHIVQLNGVSKSTLQRLLDHGHRPCLIIDNGDAKHTVVLSTKMDSSLSAQQNRYLSNYLQQELFRLYGDARDAMDPTSSMQSILCPGFINQSKLADGNFPRIKLMHAALGDCEKLSHMLPVSIQSTIETKSHGVAVLSNDIYPPETTAYLAHVKSIRDAASAGMLNIRLRRDGSLDQSSIDGLAAQRMRMTGWNRTQIEQALSGGCNDARAIYGEVAKTDPGHYAKMTVDAAMKIDLSPYAHQLKYRVFDEKVAGVISPLSVRDSEKLQSDVSIHKPVGIGFTPKSVPDKTDQAERKVMPKPRSAKRSVSRGSGLGM